MDTNKLTLDDIRIIPSDDYALHTFLLKIGDQLTEEDFKKLKFCCAGEGGLTKNVLEKITDYMSLFTHLKERRILTKYNLAPLQAMIWHLGRKDLYKDFLEYCNSQDKTLHFFVPSEHPVNGYRHVDFHIRGTDLFSSDDLEALKAAMSVLLRCPMHHIIIDGIEPTSSIHITIMIPEVCIAILLNLGDQEKKRLCLHGVDRIKVDELLIDCKDFKEDEEKPTLDKDAAVKKILQQNRDLQMDVENYQLAIEQEKENTKEYISNITDALLELRYAVEICEEERDEITRKLQNIIDEYDEKCSELNKVIEKAHIVTSENFCKDALVDLKDTAEKCETEREEIICKLQNIVDESNFGETRHRISEYGCKETLLYSRGDVLRSLSQLDKLGIEELEEKSCDIQSQIIEILQTSQACEITSDIVQSVQTERKNLEKLKENIQNLVNVEVFDKVYSAVQRLKKIEDVILVKKRHRSTSLTCSSDQES
ncbi:uncharacterized protein LOC127700602 isoform X1 [Mytilus californianus]|uniref:uncharacterized protein LOC127700602 isoform X1 n=2 Tax=Mytilus californianus TaxID=6549 RepID=UPI0022464964|nr:uncharacterized protein LOC127700602 isoform X1 [Mytilus californianus]